MKKIKALHIKEALYLLTFEDTRYRKYFECATGPGINRMHLAKDYACCAFCSRLRRSPCHDYCFSCAEKTYEECSPILPGTYPFTGLYAAMQETDLKPWIYKKPCEAFTRLEPERYFRNFIASDPEITTANYESLEGLYLGLSRGKKPCHLCASVDIAIYNNCFRNEAAEENTPCRKVKKSISCRYHAADLP